MRLTAIHRLETRGFTRGRTIVLGFTSGRTLVLGLASPGVATGVVLFVALGAAISPSD